MFGEIYVACQQGQVLQERLVRESLQDRIWWLDALRHRVLKSK